MKVKVMDHQPARPVFGTKVTDGEMSPRERALRKLVNQPEAPQAPAQEAQKPVNLTIPAESPSTRSVENGDLNTSIEAKPDAVASRPEGTKEEDASSSRFALLARKEKALQDKAKALESKLKAERESLESEKNALKARETDYQSKYISKDKLKSDLPQILTELGMSAEQISDLLLNAPKGEDIARNTEISNLNSVVKSLEDKIANLSKTFEDTQKQSESAGWSQIHSDVKRLITSDPTFELISATDSSQDVVDKIKEVYENEGYLIDFKDAATQVENELLEQAIKISSLNKIKEKLAPKQEAVEAQKNPYQQQQTKLKTLTNSVSSNRSMSALERARLAFENKLNK